MLYEERSAVDSGAKPVGDERLGESKEMREQVGGRSVKGLGGVKMVADLCIRGDFGVEHGGRCEF